MTNKLEEAVARASLKEYFIAMGHQDDEWMSVRIQKGMIYEMAISKVAIRAIEDKKTPYEIGRLMSWVHSKASSEDKKKYADNPDMFGGSEPEIWVRKAKAAIAAYEKAKGEEGK